MVKSIILLLILMPLFSSGQKVYQQTGVLDAPFISEKYFTTARSLDYSIDLPDEIYLKYIRDSLTLTLKQQQDIDKYGFRYIRQSLPFCYLLYEDDYWTQRVYRTVNLKDSANAYFTRGGMRYYTIKNEDKSLTRTPQYYKEQSLLSLAKLDIERGYLTPYYDIAFHHPDSSFVDSVLTQFDKIDHLLIKEDWYYDKVAGEIKSSIMGIGFMLEGSTRENQKPLFWVYYPEFTYGLTSIWVDIAPTKYLSWAKVLENHHYETNEIYIDGVRDNTQSWDIDDYYADYNLHRNDFEALIEIELIKEHIAQARPKYHGIFKDTTAHGLIISGEMKLGVAVGTWQVSYTESKKLTVNFVNGVALGDYHSYYESGKLKEKGAFHMGKKAGTWTSYHDNGKKLSLKNYENGWTEGEQNVWYANGKLHLNYEYINHQLNGPFVWNDMKGTSIMQGQLKNNYIDGIWKVNLPLHDIHYSILNNNNHLDWSFDAKIVKNGYLPYTVKVEQYTDPLYCVFKTCVRVLKFTFGE